MNTLNLILMVAALALVGVALVLYVANAVMSRPTGRVSWTRMQRAGFRPFGVLELLALPFVEAMRGLSVMANRVIYPNRIALANDNLVAKTHCESKTFKADGALTRYLLLKIGSDANHVTTAGAGDLPVGNSDDEPEAAEDLVAVQLFGITKHSRIGIASEAITAGEDVYTAAGGKLQDLPAGAGTYYLVGHSLQAAAGDGDKFEFVPCKPVRTVVA